MKKKKDTTASLSKDELRKQLKRKNSALEKLKREQQIEAALEKVRARTMAMQKSDELQDAAIILFQEIGSLGVETGSCGFNIVNKEKKTANVWMSSAEGRLQAPFEMPLTESPIYRPVFTAMKKGEEFLVKEVSGNAIEKHFKYLLTLPGIGDVIKQLIETGYEFPGTMVYHFAFFNTGFLSFHTHKHFPKAHEIFKRFGKVFDQTYTRFLDLQKAEIQARESKIQLALERVRARTMAMQKSEELSETVHILFQQFQALGENPDQATIGVINEKDWVIEYWVTMYGKQMDKVFKFSIEEPNVTNRIYRAWKEEKKSLVIDLSGKELFDFANYRATMGGAAYNENEKRRIINVAFFSKGLINVQSNLQRSEESIHLLERFALVFDQTYTRFLDLQKAEAQAREAQIEAALERVRSRSMAMHKSDELAPVALLMDNEIAELGIVVDNTSIVTDFQEVHNGLNTWIAVKGINYLQKFHVPFGNDHPVSVKIVDAINQRETYYTEQYSKSEKDNYYKWLFRYSDFKSLPGERKKIILNQKGWTRALCLSTNSILIFHRHNLLNFSNDEAEVFKRFSKVFEQTYTRFLDLQKAEAQSREAHIEAALEKVRSRSLAMHKSDELNEVVSILFEKLKELQFSVTAVGIGIYINGSKDLNAYVCGENEEGLVISNYRLPYFHHKISEDFSNVRKKQLDFFVGHYSKEEKNSFYEYVFEHAAELRYLPDDIKSMILESPSYTISMVAVKNALFNINDFEGKDLSDNEVDIIKRFAKVFDQTYIRFLDLQKAEAQAREAQIETALERVRSRTMGMQKSEELKEVIQLVYEQFVHLNIHIEHTGFLMDYKERDDMHIWLADQHLVPSEVIIPFFDSPPNNNIKDAKEKGQDFFTYNLTFEEKNKFYRDLFKYVPGVPEESLEYYFNCPGLAGSGVLLENVGLYIENFSGIPYTDEDNNTLMRFGKVFQQTYTRFNDLQKAEAQAREAQIELSLERVRAKTMAMHNSQHVAETVVTLFDELVKLGINKTTRSGIAIIGDKKDMEIWTASSGADGQIGMDIGRIDLMMHPMIRGFVQSWKNKEANYNYEFLGEDLKEYFMAINNSPGYPVQFDLASLPSKLVHSSFFFPEGALYAFSPEPLTAEASKIFKRFAGVFAQTYRRFLDLQKAESQARSAKVETAMEKVRARSLAMQKPEELIEVAEVLRKEMGSLGVEELETSSIYIVDEEKQTAECWYAIKDVREGDKKLVSDHMAINLHDTWVGREMLQFYSSGEKQISILMQGENRKEWINYCAERSNSLQGYYGDEIPERTYHLVKFSNGYMGAASPGIISAESWELLHRATAVFSFAYTRFVDLQNAAARAREAQIELALERVRARTMAMFKSDELAETAEVVFEQIAKLGETPDRTSIGVMDETAWVTDVWATDQAGSQINVHFKASMDEGTTIHKLYEAWKEEKKTFVVDLHGDELNDWIDFVRNGLGMPIKDEYFHGRRLHNVAFFSQGWINLTTLEPLPVETFQVLERFASVFNLTYTRFLDLQKAEAQAREATIEAALERVRGKAMAMRTSDDLSATASMVFAELRKLGINPIRCGVGIYNQQSHKVEFYAATSSANGDSLSMTGGADISSHRLFEAQYESWLKKENYFTVLKGDDLVSYYKVLSAGYTQSNLDNEGEQDQYGHWLMFSEGFLFAWSENKYTATEISILDRFKKIVELTFKRYLDLQRSEANTREAVKQAALDRVRADIASMRTPNDLQRITPLVWNELMILGIPFIRCGVFIMDEENQQIHTFLSTPEGKAIAAFHLPYDTPGNFAEVVSHWRQKKKYVNHWGQADFISLAESLVRQGAIATKEQYISSMPKDGIHLHFLPFLQGMLYVGNEAPLNDDALQLVQNLADAFSTAYARYEDFNKLEAAKQTVEKTLVDLKQAQQQLVQSEKMASLGELTAGIAHEIQNPLNFVNNFSEVSNELIVEMNEELDKGDIQEAKAIANDIKQNLEKINHHGKRADGIVKGMLQHSRSSTGAKEPTDINALADEYLRLSYHGLRAKDKDFNATIKTDFDKSIGKINIIPQDIGRVLLNLYNNAFYAVAEKRKLNVEGYEPAISVSTKKADNKITITVKDNGNGIPQNIVDKIFQPFFTTKPTGQGTGLGLSLSYDIVKAHGGEIQVETKEGERTNFIIQLPLI